MILLWLDLLAVVLLGLIVLLRGRDDRLGWSMPARRLVISGFIPLGLQASVYLLFGLGEMLSGDPSGAGHLIPVLTMVLLGLLTLRRPLEGGVTVVILGLLTAAFYGRSALVITWPLPLSGVLFIAGAVMSHRATGYQTSQKRLR